MTAQNNHINYVEFTAQDLDAVKKFYTKAFGWTFTDYGPTYTSFSDSGLAGGCEKSDAPVVHGTVSVLYHKDREGFRDVVVASGGKSSR
jgi:predicted enzyme related to lactoylglutathione lyase